jgi:photosystem II stability/assembly factor-like uncharacterized protein
VKTFRERKMMFTPCGGKQRFCDGLTRRGFLQIGAFGAGLTLADMLCARVCAGDTPTPAPSPKIAITIHVGSNVHVSKARPDYHHWEVILAEGIGHGGDLFAASIVHSPSDIKKQGQPVGTVVVYASRDEGKIWTPVLDFEPNPGGFDPALARGPRGEVYFACNEGALSKKLLRIVRSSDGGRTWEPSAKIAGPWERPFMAVDRTDGKFRGRVYCTAGSALFVSADAGKSFDKVRSVLKPFGNPVVLADGTLAVLCGSMAWGEQEGQVGVRTSSDGGDSFSEERIIAKYRMVDPWIPPPVMAADPARPGGLYVVWQDRLPSRRAGVLFTASADKGTTFSRPVLLSEQPEEGAGYDAFVPSVAVNPAGTVAVSWYDRRALDREQAGWDVRLRASGDGGQTWAPSVPVTEETTLLGKKARTDRDGVGHTAGLASEGDGGFRCLWVDGRTGVAQVWTAAVRIEATRKSRP